MSSASTSSTNYSVIDHSHQLNKQSQYLQNNTKKSANISIQDSSIEEENLNPINIKNRLDFLQMIKNLIKKIINIIQNNNDTKKDISSNNQPLINDNQLLSNLQTKLYNKLLNLNNEIDNDDQYKEHCNKIINYLYLTCQEEYRLDQEYNASNVINKLQNDIDNYIEVFLSKITNIYQLDIEIIPNTTDNNLETALPKINNSNDKEITLETIHEKIEKEILELQKLLKCYQFNKIIKQHKNYESLKQSKQDLDDIKEYYSLNLKCFFADGDFENKKYLISISEQIIESIFEKLPSNNVENLTNLFEILHNFFDSNQEIHKCFSINAKNEVIEHLISEINIFYELLNNTETT